MLGYPIAVTSKRPDEDAILWALSLAGVFSRVHQEEGSALLTQVSEDKGPIVVVEGEIDLAVAPSLREQLEALLAEGHHTLYVDLLKATFLDSTALGVLVTTREQCRSAGGELHLIVNEPRILKVLEITGLSSAFPIHDSRDAIAGTNNGDETDPR